MAWGDEIYFEAGIAASYDDIKLSSEIDVGDVAYWPQGKCICVFFGSTPISKAGKPMPLSPVVIIGKTKNSSLELRKIKAGDPIRVVQVQENISVPFLNARKPDRRLTQKEIDALV